MEGLLESLVEFAVSSFGPDIGFLAVVSEFLEDVVTLEGCGSGLVGSNVVEVLVLEGVLNIIQSGAVTCNSVISVRMDLYGRALTF